MTASAVDGRLLPPALPCSPGIPRRASAPARAV